MLGLVGEICTTPEDLKRTSRKRSHNYIIKSIYNREIDEYIKKGWEIIKQGKTSTRIRKQKLHDEIFEDRVWMIFYNLGFTNLNKDRKFKIEYGSYTKQIDIVAKDEENIFIVECKSTQTEDIINAKETLEEFVGKRGDFNETIKREWGRDCGKLNLVVVINSESCREDDYKYVKDKRDKNIFLWNRKDLSYIECLYNQIGKTAKYQLYSVIFSGRKQRNLNQECLALKSKVGGKIIYSFLISAKKLLNYAYVHHRRLIGIIEASQAYQRMLRSSKINEIKYFIEKEDGFFPNSIIINFTESLRWNKKQGDNDISVGTVILPEYYGCAWIIDGQHRLYGAASVEKDIVLPVIAFENLNQKEQANLFVEINEKQKKVPPDLLWDLYSDIYRDSNDKKQIKLYQIAEIAKLLENNGPLNGYIEIPSIPRERKTKLTLTTICTTIDKYSPWDQLIHPSDIDKTPQNAARLINIYYEVLHDLWPEDWNKGDKSVILSNNGFGVFIMIFNDIIKHLVYKGKDDLLAISKSKELRDILTNKFLKYIIEYLKTDQDTQNDIKTKTGRGPQNDNAAYLDLKLKDFITDFIPARIGELPLPPADSKPPAVNIIEERVNKVEGILRSYILEKLIAFYGEDKWWKQGIPGDPKKQADKKWQEEITRKPHLKNEANQNEMKFSYLDLGQMIDIICYTSNWIEIFEQIFIDKDQLQRRIRDIAALRNPVSHQRKIDDQDVNDGKGGLLWLSNCLGKKEINPYA